MDVVRLGDLKGSGMDGHGVPIDAIFDNRRQGLGQAQQLDVQGAGAGGMTFGIGMAGVELGVGPSSNLNVSGGRFASGIASGSGLVSTASGGHPSSPMFTSASAPGSAPGSFGSFGQPTVFNNLLFHPSQPRT